jgi:hypothetical protein
MTAKGLIVTVKDRFGNEHNIYVDTDRPEVVGNALAKIHREQFRVSVFADGNGVALRAGKLTAELLRKLPRNSRPFLIPDRDEYVGASQYRVQVAPGDTATANVKLRVTRFGPEGETPVFHGNFNQFAAWMTTFKQYERYRDKRVVFFYKGGSDEGNRVVDVTAIEYNDGVRMIRGKDVLKTEAEKKDAWRMYDEGKIQGKIMLFTEGNAKKSKVKAVEKV